MFSVEVISTSIASGAAVAGKVKLGSHQTGAIVVPSAWTAAAITFLVCDTEGGTYYPCKDESGAEYSITGITTNAVGSYNIPSGVMTHAFCVAQSGVTGTTVNQAAARTLKFVLK